MNYTKLYVEIMMPNTELWPETFQQFADYKTIIQGCSQKTVSEYLLDLKSFFSYVVIVRRNEVPTTEMLEKENISSLDISFIENVKTSEIYEYLNYKSKPSDNPTGKGITGRPNGKNAIARKLSAIKSFYKYLTVKRHYFEDNPAANIDSPKKPKTLPKHLTESESKKLLEAVYDDPLGKNKKRDYCILTLFLNCGMRLSELCGISLSDIDPDLHSLRVIGKGSKERIVYLNEACRQSIIEYLPIRKSEKEKGVTDNAFFVSRLGKRISPKTVQWLVKKYLGEAGLEYKHYSTHKLRHTAATLMYQSGKVDIRVLKDILGHEQLTTTQIYTHVSDAGMQAAMENNPLANYSVENENKDNEPEKEDNSNES